MKQVKKQMICLKVNPRTINFPLFKKNFGIFNEPVGHGNTTSCYTTSFQYLFIKGRIHCEIILSEHFMKYSLRVISCNMKYFHEILLL